jgi:hypothetical protein
MNARFILAVLIVSTFASSETTADPLDPRVIKPDASIDLRTRSGVDLVGGQWRYSDARIVEVDHRAPGHDLKASGDSIRTHDIEPKAGVAGFDDSSWAVIDATSLEGRRGTGRLSFGYPGSPCPSHSDRRLEGATAPGSVRMNDSRFSHRSRARSLWPRHCQSETEIELVLLKSGHWDWRSPSSQRSSPARVVAGTSVGLDLARPRPRS